MTHFPRGSSGSFSSAADEDVQTFSEVASDARESRPWIRFRFDLKSALLLIAVLCVAFAYAAFQRMQARTRMEAARMVRRGGGWLVYDHQAPRRSEFWRQILGNDRFASSEYLYLQHMDLGERQFELISSFPRLRVLGLGDCQFENDDMRRALDLPALEQAHFPGSSLDDNGARYLLEAGSLAGFYAPRTKITDGCAASIAQASELADLDLSDTAVGDIVATEIAKCTSLVRLHLIRTRVTDQGVSELAKLPRLESLSLSGANLTDASLEALRSAPSLRELRIYDTALTEDAIARFQVARPEVLVFSRHMKESPALFPRNQAPGAGSDTFDGESLASPTTPWIDIPEDPLVEAPASMEGYVAPPYVAP